MISTRAIAILLIMMQGITFWVCESYSDTSGESAVHSYRTKPNDLNNDTLQSEHTLCVQKKRPEKKRMRMFAGEKAGWLVKERERWRVDPEVDQTTTSATNRNTGTNKGKE